MTWESALRPIVSPNHTAGSADLRPIAGHELGLMSWTPAAQYPAGGPFATISAEFEKANWDESAADLDAVEISGFFGPSKHVLVYWGASDQHEWGFGQLALFNGSMAEWLQLPFKPA